MKILYPLYVTGFDAMTDNNNKKADTAGKDMICTILYLENSDTSRSTDLKKRVKNNYILNKVEYPRTVTTVHSLILNYQHNYNSNSQY